MASTAALYVVAVGLTVGLAPAGAQESAQDTVQAASDTMGLSETVVYRREVFVYPSDGRANPFVSIIDPEAQAGPQFADLDLVGVIFGGPAGSVATLVDRATDKRYRIRRGDMVGNARVVEIRPEEVVFSVTEFGVSRSETLRIRRQEEQG